MDTVVSAMFRTIVKELAIKLQKKETDSNALCCISLTSKFYLITVRQIPRLSNITVVNESFCRSCQRCMVHGDWPVGTGGRAGHRNLLRAPRRAENSFRLMTLIYVLGTERNSNLSVLNLTMIWPALSSTKPLLLSALILWIRSPFSERVVVLICREKIIIVHYYLFWNHIQLHLTCISSCHDYWMLTIQMLVAVCKNAV